MRDFGFKPVLIEVNRMRPSLCRLFALDEQRSLAALLSRDGSVMECVQYDPAGLAILPAGPARRDAPSVPRLESALCCAVQELQNHFDFILVDAPPILESADVLVAGRLIPQVVLVVAAGQTSSESLARVGEQLRDAGLTVVGTILNHRKRIIPKWIDRWLRK